MKITVATGVPVTAEQLDECERFARAVLSAPGARVIVEQGVVAPNPDSGASLPFAIHQASRDGIVDPILLAYVRRDEDVYRDARRANFPSLGPQDALAVLLPADGAALDLRHILPLYDRAYVPIEAFDDVDAPYGITWAEVLALVHLGRLVPVVSRRVGGYDQRRLLELLEARRVVLTRELTARTAATILDANPLWRIANADPA